MKKKELAIILEKHLAWINGKYGGERANLQRANLQDADLDYSCLPIWCGGSKFRADMRIVRQILAHVCAIEIMDADESIKAAIEAILPEAKKSHRASDLGIM